MIVLSGLLCVPCAVLFGVGLLLGAAAPLYAALVLALVAAAGLPLGVLAGAHPRAIRRPGPAGPKAGHSG